MARRSNGRTASFHSGEKSPPAVPGDYEYDVFVSYKQGSLYGQWVELTFLPLFKELLKEELPYKPEVFFDRSGLSPADAFPARLRHALATSRCMVAVWT